MEAFFEQGSELRFWPAEASVTQLECSESWPPVIASSGYAPGVRAWQPQGKATKAQFAPVDQLREVDGSRCVACAVQGGLLAAADASPSGRISLWDVQTWQRQQTLQAGAPVVSLAFADGVLAVGTAAGAAVVWRQAPGGEFVKLFEKDLQLDVLPLYSVKLGKAPDDSPLLVVHSMGRNAIGVWRLVDGKLVHRMGMETAASDPKAVAAANVMHAHVAGSLLATVSWLPGQDPVVQLMNVISREGSMVDAPERLSGRGKPLSADFDGALLAVGFEDGAVATFGYRGWLRWHGGAVGAVRVVPHRGQVLSGGADRVLRLWDVEGALLASLDMGFQITALAAGDVFAAAAGSTGAVQLVVLAAEEEHVAAARAAAAAEAQRCSSQPAAGSVIKYDLWFDARTAGATANRHGRASDHPEAFAAFVPARRQVTADHFAAQQQQDAAAGGSAGAGSGGAGAGAAEAAAGAGAAGGTGSSSGSGFRAQSALQGAERDHEAEKAREREAAKQRQLQQMGEAVGVARNADVLLESSTARMGRKCDNVSCLNRSGLANQRFMRCSGCKVMWYCSQHCQRTHWRDGHQKQCKLLAAERATQAAALAQQQQQVAAPAAVVSSDDGRGQQQQQQEAAGGAAPSDDGRGQQQQQQQEVEVEAKSASTAAALGASSHTGAGSSSSSSTEGGLRPSASGESASHVTTVHQGEAAAAPSAAAAAAAPVAEEGPAKEHLAAASRAAASAQQDVVAAKLDPAAVAETADVAASADPLARAVVGPGTADVAAPAAGAADAVGAADADLYELD